VVIDKQLFARAKKDKFQKVQEKELLSKLEDTHAINMNELKTILIDKLMTLLDGKISEGVKSIYNEELVPKGSKFTPKAFKDMDYTSGGLFRMDQRCNTNEMIARLLHNYSIKVNEELGDTSVRNLISASG
jgi:DNA-directed RNA polymerase subunit beta